MAGTPKPLIAGNWKMNGLRHEAEALIGALAAKRAAEPPPGCEMLVCPPATAIAMIADMVAKSGMVLGGQDCHPAAAGAHTGDISPAMLAEFGCAYVIVGHSERRADHAEDNALVRAKAEAARSHGMSPIICIGETAAQRDSGDAVSVVLSQIDGSLPPGSGADTVLAYEPVWAIGTGRTPTTAEIAEVHSAIRERLLAGGNAGAAIRILYGGSVKPDNAAEILAVDHVNGALVGGASLVADDFWAICQACG